MTVLLGDVAMTVMTEGERERDRERERGGTGGEASLSQIKLE